jgi:putative two-component system response regulator
MSRGYPEAMHRLLDSVEDYDPDLRGHVNRVAAIAVRIGMRMRLNASHLREVALAAQLHDVGKIAIPRAILMKATALTPAEFETVKRHTLIGQEIVGRVPALAVACRGVGEHHERWDGAGYPYAREGQAISLTARIVAVADVYDALVSKRSYKDGWDRAEALAEIVRGAGSHFDPRVVDELIHVVGETEQVVRAAAA